MSVLKSCKRCVFITFLWLNVWLCEEWFMFYIMTLLLDSLFKVYNFFVSKPFKEAGLRFVTSQIVWKPILVKYLNNLKAIHWQQTSQKVELDQFISVTHLDNHRFCCFSCVRRSRCHLNDLNCMIFISNTVFYRHLNICLAPVSVHQWVFTKNTGLQCIMVS